MTLYLCAIFHPGLSAHRTEGKKKLWKSRDFFPEWSKTDPECMTGVVALAFSDVVDF